MAKKRKVRLKRRVKRHVTQHIRKGRKKLNSVQLKIRTHIATAILAAFAFIIALIWRDTIREGVDKIVATFPIDGNGYAFKIVSAMLVTVICVIGIIIFSRWAEKK